MNQRKLRRIKIGILSGVLGFFFVFGLIVFSFIGPFRSFFWNIPYLTGFFGSKTYLVLLQNNNELRPTGGFISAFATVSFLFGYPTISVFDSYQIKDPIPSLPAEEPFEFLIGKNDPFFRGLTFRDANFSPDFLESSKEIIKLYQKAYPDEEIDGVIALDFEVIEKLLALYGPFQIENEVFDENNFFLASQRLSKNIDTHNIDDLSKRKDVLKPLTKILMDEIIFSPTKYSRLLKILYELGLKKDVLFFFAAENLEQKAENLRLSGRLKTPPGPSDFLHVNVANIGGRKADRYVKKEVSSFINFEAGKEGKARLEISLEHFGSYNIQSDIYQAYIRSYVPLESRLITSAGNTLRSTQVFSEKGFTVFADTIRLNPGERITLSYFYELPSIIQANDYHLQIVKQAGVQDQYWHITVKEPNDTGLINAEKDLEVFSIRENLAFWQGILEEDFKAHLQEQQDTKGPIILWQEFKSPTLINVRFNELIHPETVLKDFITILDRDEKNSIHDTITITETKFDERDLWITINGLTRQEEERYDIIFEKVTDQNGNPMDPLPHTRTLVQRLSW